MSSNGDALPFLRKKSEADRNASICKFSEGTRISYLRLLTETAPEEEYARDIIDEGVCLIQNNRTPQKAPDSSPQSGESVFYLYDYIREPFYRPKPPPPKRRDARVSPSVEEQTEEESNEEEPGPSEAQIDLVDVVVFTKDNLLTKLTSSGTGRRESMMRVLAFQGCEHAGEFAKYIAQGSPSKQQNLAPVFDSPNLKATRDAKFKVGVAFNAELSKNALGLLVAIPYLKYGNHVDLGDQVQPNTERETLNLAEFGCPRLNTRTVITAPTPDPRFLIHQAWFLTFGKGGGSIGTIATFKSKEDKGDTFSPLFPYQSRYHFPALVHMIGNMLCTSTGVIDSILPGETAKLLYDIQDGNGGMAAETGAVLNQQSSNIYKLTAEHSAVRRVVQCQIQILEDLRRVLEEFREPEDKTKAYLIVPQLSDLEAQVLPAVKAVGDLIAGLKRAKESIEKNIEELEIARRSVKPPLPSPPPTQVKALLTASQTVVEDKATEIKEDVSELLQTMSAFTIVGTVFLPLQFLSQYFALDYNKLSSASQFWAWCGPVTLAIAVFNLFVVFNKKGVKWRQEWPFMTTRRGRREGEVGGRSSEVGGW